MKRKRTVLPVFLEQNAPIVTVICMFCLFLFTTILGRLVLLLPINIDKEFFCFPGYLLIGLLTEICLILFLLLSYSFVNIISLFILKQKAIYNYLYLPLTADEIEQEINNKKIENNVESYLEYLEKKVSYHPLIPTDTSYAIQFTRDDIFNVMKSIKEVFNTKSISFLPNKNMTFIKDFIETESIAHGFFLSTFYTRINLTLLNDNTIQVNTSGNTANPGIENANFEISLSNS